MESTPEPRTLADYYFAHAEMVVIPIEHLSSAGMSESFATLLGRQATLPDGWVTGFNDAFATYWGRAAELSARVPHEWFPPRVQHVAIVLDADRVRPYFQPFNQSSWLLYASDFDPAVSQREFAAYQFLHAERMGLLREVTQAVVRNLSYWLLRGDDEVAGFVDGCRRATRPDASAFRALAAALPWIRRLWHESLKPLTLTLPEPVVRVPHTGLLMAQSHQRDLDRLVQQWTTVARAVMDRFHGVHARRGRDHGGEVCAWLRDRQPQLLLTGGEGRVLWDPRDPADTKAVRAEISGIAETVAASLRADIEVIDRHSREFLASLRDPAALPSPPAETGQSGLSYMHLERRMIAYNLREAGMERLRVPAPPYERFMLGARTIHEWGHLAVDAGWVPVAADRRAQHAALIEELGEQFETICHRAPEAIQRHTAENLAHLTRDGTRLGAALARITLARLPDYQANLLAQRYLGLAERETYIRNNVYSLSLRFPTTAMFRRLARYAFEMQYLRFSQIPDPFSYFVQSTWAADEYLRSGAVAEPTLRRLLDLVGQICGGCAVDETRFQPPVV